MRSKRNLGLWFLLLAVIAIAFVGVAFSPQLAWRGPLYIAASFAAVLGMVLLLIQPLLAGRYLPDLNPLSSRKFHQIAGSLLVLCVIAHVIGLWITSPPDMVDALLFRSPTPFSLWGVLGMWAIFVAAFLAIFKKRLHIKHSSWRFAHFTFAAFGATFSVAHAMQIEGAMETYSKVFLCALVLAATAKLGVDLYMSKFQGPKRSDL